MRKTTVDIVECIRYSESMLKQLKIVGGADRTNQVVFFSVGTWFQILMGVPDSESLYINVFGTEVSR